jgi:CS domain
MVDYKKFDDIVESDSDEERIVSTLPVQPNTQVQSLRVNTKAATKKGADGRLKFEHDGNTIYEWEQSLEEVNIYIIPPMGLRREMIDVEISHLHVRIGVLGSPPFIDEDTGGPIKAKESFWTLSDGEININLQKMNKAEAWTCALRGQSGEEIDEITKDEVKKKLMIERFQEEVSTRNPPRKQCNLTRVSQKVSLFLLHVQHPSFDFSSAEFNGIVPDAREFMGGVKRS